MAPIISPAEIDAPIRTVLGKRMSATAIISITPVRILPHGSTLNCVNIQMDSSAPVNLKNSVWASIPAMIILMIQFDNVLIFT